MSETTGSQVALLHRISNIVSSDQDLEAILNELVGLTMKVTHSDACLVYLIDHSSNEIVLSASQLPHDAEIGNVRMKMGEGITGWVAVHNSVVALSRDASKDARFKTFQNLPEDTFQSFLSVPLVNQGELVGVINVHHREAHQHTSDEVALVTFIGEQMGGLIGRRKLAEQSQSAVKRLETLAAVAEALSTESYLERILQAISEMLAETLDSPVCSILLMDHEKQEVAVGAVRCSAPEYLHKMPISMEESLVEHVVKEAQPVYIPNIHTEKKYKYPELARKTGLTSVLASPMLSQGKVIGTVNIYTKTSRTFTEDELGFIKVVAGQAAIAISNARLMNETLEMKRTLEARKLIERAKGILQYKHHLTEEEAYLRLRNESRRLRRPMRDLAEAVILADDLNRKDGSPKIPIREDSEIL